MINNIIMVIRVYFLIAGFHKFKVAAFELYTLQQSKTYQTSSFQQILVSCFSYYYSLPHIHLYSYVVTHQQIWAPSACALSCHGS